MNFQYDLYFFIYIYISEINKHKDNERNLRADMFCFILRLFSERSVLLISFRHLVWSSLRHDMKRSTSLWYCSFKYANFNNKKDWDRNGTCVTNFHLHVGHCSGWLSSLATWLSRKTDRSRKCSKFSSHWHLRIGANVSLCYPGLSTQKFSIFAVEDWYCIKLWVWPHHSLVTWTRNIARKK